MTYLQLSVGIECKFVRNRLYIRSLHSQQIQYDFFPETFEHFTFCKVTLGYYFNLFNLPSGTSVLKCKLVHRMLYPVKKMQIYYLHY